MSLVYYETIFYFCSICMSVSFPQGLHNATGSVQVKMIFFVAQNPQELPECGLWRLQNVIAWWTDKQIGKPGCWLMTLLLTTGICFNSHFPSSVILKIENGWF